MPFYATSVLKFFCSVIHFMILKIQVKTDKGLC